MFPSFRETELSPQKAARRCSAQMNMDRGRWRLVSHFRLLGRRGLQVFYFNQQDGEGAICHQTAGLGRAVCTFACLPACVFVRERKGKRDQASTAHARVSAIDCSSLWVCECCVPCACWHVCVCVRAVCTRMSGITSCNFLSFPQILLSWFRGDHSQLWRHILSQLCCIRWALSEFQSGCGI